MSEIKVLIVYGVARSGKDLFVDYLKEHNPHIEKHSTVGTIKSIAKEHFGWSGKKTFKDRKFLSDLKNLWTEYDDGPFLEIVNHVKLMEHGFLKDPDPILAVFVREPKEIQKIKDEFSDAIAVLVQRPGIEVPDNMADQNVEDFNYDYILVNDSTLDEFKLTASTFHQLIEEKYAN